MRKWILLSVLFYTLVMPVAAQEADRSDSSTSANAGAEASVLRLDLAKALELAFQNNNRSKVSKDAVDAALALHGQALSSLWPQVAASIVGSRMDQDPDFIFPASKIPLPASSLTVPSQTILIPANSFGPGLPPVNVPLQTPPTTIDIPAQSIQVPEQDLKLMNRDNLISSVKVTYPIYTGGLRTARIRQAKQGIEVARQDERRTDLEVAYDVKRLYYAGVLSKKLVAISRDTLARMEATLDLTEKLYTTGSGTVKKTDYLRNKSIVELLRSTTAELESNEKKVEAALVAAIGLDWATQIELADEEIPFPSGDYSPKSFVERALRSNADVAKLEAAIKAAQENVAAARSGHYPKAALFGTFQRIENSYDAGLMTDTNKTAWALGIQIDIPIFEGFKVSKEVMEARAQLRKLEHQLDLLRDSIAMDVQTICCNIQKTQEQQKSSLQAFQSAKENRELNVRAYQDELVETKDVIEAQILEALLSAQYQNVLYDHAESLAKLDLVSGVEPGQQPPGSSGSKLH
jgi:outer membrane protein TolC